MKKLFLGIGTLLLGSFLFLTVDASATENQIDSLPTSVENTDLDSTSIFIDSNLIGTKIDVPKISTRDGGYLYKNKSWSESNKKKTYLGKVDKGLSVSFGVTTAKGYIQIGLATSSTRQYKEYRNNVTFKSTWGVYDKYSGNYMYSTTFTQNLTYNSYERVK